MVEGNFTITMNGPRYCSSVIMFNSIILCTFDWEFSSHVFDIKANVLCCCVNEFRIEYNGKSDSYS